MGDKWSKWNIYTFHESGCNFWKILVHSKTSNLCLIQKKIISKYKFSYMIWVHSLTGFRKISNSCLGNLFTAPPISTHRLVYVRNCRRAFRWKNWNDNKIINFSSLNYFFTTKSIELYKILSDTFFSALFENNSEYRTIYIYSM